MKPLFREIKRSLFISLWFVFLTFPLMVIKVNPLDRAVHWRWKNMLYVALVSFVLSLFVRGIMLRQKQRQIPERDKSRSILSHSFYERCLMSLYRKRSCSNRLLLCIGFPLCFFFLSDQYHDHSPNVRHTRARIKYRCWPCRSA